MTNEVIRERGAKLWESIEKVVESGHRAYGAVQQVLALRDCETCRHHEGGMCGQWDCCEGDLWLPFRVEYVDALRTMVARLQTDLDLARDRGNDEDGIDSDNEEPLTPFEQEFRTSSHLMQSENGNATSASGQAVGSEAETPRGCASCAHGPDERYCIHFNHGKCHETSAGIITAWKARECDGPEANDAGECEEEERGECPPVTVGQLIGYHELIERGDFPWSGIGWDGTSGFHAGAAKALRALAERADETERERDGWKRGIDRYKRIVDDDLKALTRIRKAASGCDTLLGTVAIGVAMEVEDLAERVERAEALAEERGKLWNDAVRKAQESTARAEAAEQRVAELEDTLTTEEGVRWEWEHEGLLSHLQEHNGQRLVIDDEEGSIGFRPCRCAELEKELARRVELPKSSDPVQVGRALNVAISCYRQRHGEHLDEAELQALDEAASVACRIEYGLADAIERAEQEANSEKHEEQ